LLRRQHPQFIPASTLGQVHRWCSVLLAQLFRGAVDLGRPADISLYHLGCFKLVLPDGRWWYLASVVLSSLQQEQQQHSLDEVLEAFRQAGAVLHVSVPKCKQCHRKRSKNGGQVIDWLPLRKHLLPPELALLCPTRTLAFCMAATWWAKGAVTARQLTLRKAGSTGKAAPKRHAQADFQGQVPAGSWKVPSSRELSSYAPSLYLLQQQKPGAEDSSTSSGSDSSEDPEDSDSPAGSSTAQYWLAHTKPRKGSSAKVLLPLRALTGSDLRDSQQVGCFGSASRPGRGPLYHYVHLFHGTPSDLRSFCYVSGVPSGSGSRHIRVCSTSTSPLGPGRPRVSLPRPARSPVAAAAAAAVMMMPGSL
jgi:hypothetical protein